MLNDQDKVQDALRKLCADAGPRAEAEFSIKAKGVMLYLRPAGWGRDSPFILSQADDFDTCLADVQSQWDKMSQQVRNEITKKIAMAIIRVTHETGSCTDAALRVHFDAADIARYGADAVALANSMAERGPFEIVFLKQANATQPSTTRGVSRQVK